MTPASVDCQWCRRPVYDGATGHPCCAIWIGAWGKRRCVACAESESLNRQYLERKKREAAEKPKRK
jgi:hypothetical protein